MTTPVINQNVDETSKINERLAQHFSRVSFPDAPVKRLTENDFSLDSRELIALKNIIDCTVILFYIDNEDSREVVRIFYETAMSSAGPLLGAVNLAQEKGVARAFANLRGMREHPLKEFTYRSLPCIIIYYKGWPVKIYNGAFTTQNLADYIVSDVCYDFNAERDLRRGVNVDNKIQLNRSQHLIHQGTNNNVNTAEDYGKSRTDSRLYVKPPELEETAPAAQPNAGTTAPVNPARRSVTGETSK